MPIGTKTVGVIVLLSVAAVPLPSTAAAQSHAAHEAREWGAATVVIGVSTLLDGVARRELYLHADSTVPTLARAGDVLGRHMPYYVALAGMAGAGYATRHPDLSQGSLRVAGALVATGLASSAVKYAVGRGRPDTPGSDGDEFHPFMGDDAWSSFPPRHAVTAFTMATAVAVEVDRPWATALAYRGASVVAWSRVRMNRHWTSDVVAGALLGTALTEGILRTLRPTPAHPGSARENSAPIWIGISLPLP